MSTTQCQETKKTMRTLLRKKLPEILISSQRTTTIFWPERICFEMIEASRPRRWPLPSMTIGLEENVAIGNLEEAEVSEGGVKSAPWTYTLKSLRERTQTATWNDFDRR